MKRKMIIFSIILMILLMVNLTIQAQPLVNRSRIEIRGGIMNHSFGTSTSIGPSGIVVTTGATGVMASIGYSKWIQENLALTFSISPIIVDDEVAITSGEVNTGTNTVTPIYMGVRYYMFEKTYGKSSHW